MKSFNLYNSKIFKIFDYLCRVVLINLLLCIPSFLLLYFMDLCFKNTQFALKSIVLLIPTIFYLYPAICASVDLFRKYELKITNSVFKEFFKSLKKFYVKALIETIILVIALLLFTNSISFFYNNIENGVIYLVSFILAVAFTIMFLAIVIHLPLVMSYMEGCRVIDDIKLAGMMAFKDLGITIALIITTIAIIVLAVNYNTIAIICGFSLPIVLIVKLTFKKYYIVYVRTHKDEK